MTEWSVPSISLLVVAPALAAVIAAPTMRRETARRGGVTVGLTVLALAIAVASMWHAEGELPASDRFDPGRLCGSAPLFTVDQLNVLLLPFVALTFAFVLMVQPNTDSIERSLRRVFATEAITLAAVLSSDPLVLAVLWCCSAAGGWYGLRSHGEDGFGGARVFAWYALPSCALVLVGAALMKVEAGVAAGTVLVALAVMIRKGIAPVHSWMPEMFACAPLPTSTLFNAPQIGAWVAIRVIAPHAPVWVLDSISFASLVTAVYGAGLALVQTNPRRVLGWLFLSQSALILVGLQSQASVAQAGALALWIASGLALTGFAMTLAALEARRGRLSLRRFAGGYERKPLLAASFLVLGLASVGFPGTLGFVGQEALALGVVSGFPHLGFAVLIAAMLNGITVLRTYFVLFCGRVEPDRVPQPLQPREQLGFVGLALALVIAGLFPEVFLPMPGKTNDLQQLSPRGIQSAPLEDAVSHVAVSQPTRRHRSVYEWPWCRLSARRWWTKRAVAARSTSVATATSRLMNFSVASEAHCTAARYNCGLVGHLTATLTAKPMDAGGQGGRTSTTNRGLADASA